MFKKLILLSLMAIGFCNYSFTALASTSNSSQTKRAVRLSLWYEGIPKVSKINTGKENTIMAGSNKYFLAEEIDKPLQNL